MGAGPLEGVLVVALEQAVAAPLATSRMADAGARVIKIERPEGDFARRYDDAGAGASSYFVWLNRGKESVVLDLKAATDLDLVRAMLAKADVFVHNLAPGAVDRLGFDDASLEALNPRLIRLGISAYGPEGPYSQRKGYDLLIQAESGLASVTGLPEAPGRIGVSVCDIATGMNAYAAVLEALIERGRTGKGRALHVSLFDTAAEWMSVPYMLHAATGEPPARIGLAHPSIAPYGAYGCAGGQEVLFSIQNEREWTAFCEVVLKAPKLAADPAFNTNALRVENRARLDAAIDTVLRELPREEVIRRLETGAIAYGAVNTTADLAHHAHLRTMTVITPGGEARLPRPPVLGSSSDPVAPVPDIGAHTGQVRGEFSQAPTNGAESHCDGRGRQRGA